MPELPEVLPEPEPLDPDPELPEPLELPEPELPELPEPELPEFEPLDPDPELPELPEPELPEPELLPELESSSLDFPDFESSLLLEESSFELVDLPERWLRAGLVNSTRSTAIR